MSFSDISIKWKILLIALAGPVIVAVILAWQRVDDTRNSAHASIIDKSKAIVLMAEATRNQMARKLELGLLKPFEEISADKIIEAVPVVTAMQTAAINADKAGYTFRAPKVSPRNPENTPTPEELKVLTEIKKNNLAEKIVITANEIRYFKPIRLTKDCLFCHGDPKGEIDPTGGVKEGWREGEIHGAFQIISSLEKTNAQINKAKMGIVFVTFAILSIISVVVWLLLQRNIIKPLNNAADYINLVANGDLTKEFSVDSKDEFGVIAKALQFMTKNLREIVQNLYETSDILHGSSEEMDQSATHSTKGAKELSERSISVANASEKMSTNMTNVAAATEQAATNISLVSEATMDMSTTISEISANTEKTQSIAEKAVSKAKSASLQVDELGEAANKIGKVTETITEISGQTNLLALNATIEAARAGEAGKGFAVVANEIKELAKQTAEATLEIKTQIDGIQNTTENTVVEIQAISAVINEVNEIVVMVVAAVEEQNIKTNQIADNISQATLGIQEVTENVSQSSVVADEVANNISEVSNESGAIAERSEELTDKASKLKELSVKLKSMVERFKVER